MIPNEQNPEINNNNKDQDKTQDIEKIEKINEIIKKANEYMLEFEQKRQEEIAKRRKAYRYR